VKIRKAKEIDARGIAKVHVKTWRTTYKGIVSDQYLNNLSYHKREENWRANLTSSDVFVRNRTKAKSSDFHRVERSGVPFTLDMMGNYTPSMF
jgi:hypothetical protein